MNRMADVVFYEKPGCAGNNRQKRLLAESGHTVEARSLLAEPWTAETLRPFFGNRPVTDWFNHGAAAVKSGAVDPQSVSEAEALALMIANPMLIRRPLMQVGERRECGFQPELVDEWIGLTVWPNGPSEGCVRPFMPPCPAPSDTSAADGANG